LPSIDDKAEGARGEELARAMLKKDLAERQKK
jgi:hypothetical protein